MEAMGGEDCGSHSGSSCPWEEACIPNQLAALWAPHTPEFPVLFPSSIHLLCPNQSVNIYNHIHVIEEETKDQNVGDRSRTPTLCYQRLKSFLY